MQILDTFKKAFNLQGNSNPSGVSDYAIIPKSYPWDWWQKAMPEPDVATSAIVESCVSTISQTVAMLPVNHIRVSADGEATIVQNSAASRVLRNPNPLQTKSAFWVDFVRAMLLTGNGYGAVTRNNRFEINALYPQSKLAPYVTPDSKEVYYSTTDHRIVDLDNMLPARDVLHVVMHTINHPLIGVTPLEAAKYSVSTGLSINGHTNTFFSNMARPSGVLRTDMTLTADQTKALRERFESLSTDLGSGGVPILTNGLTYEAITMSAVDADIIETYKMTKEDIASVFRVPPSLLGMMEKATFANTESLMKFWISSGLGYILEHLENSLERLFDLPVNERIEFNTDFLLEADFKSRFEAYKVGVTGGFITPNEIRKKEGFKTLAGGDELFMQMQNTPIAKNGEKLQVEIDKVKQEIECNKDCNEAPPEPVVLESTPEPELKQLDIESVELMVTI